MSSPLMLVILASQCKCHFSRVPAAEDRVNRRMLSGQGARSYLSHFLAAPNQALF